MTDPIRRTMRDMTGNDVPSCPWRAMRDALVVRVFAALPFFESGQLAFVTPAPSHRLVSAISYYQTVSNRIYARQLELERQHRARAPNVVHATASARR